MDKIEKRLKNQLKKLKIIKTLCWAINNEKNSERKIRLLLKVMKIKKETKWLLLKLLLKNDCKELHNLIDQKINELKEMLKTHKNLEKHWLI